MLQIALILVIALTFSMAATPIAKWVALRIGVVSVPRARDVHLSPVPMLGGAAIYFGFAVAVIFFGDQSYIRELIGIMSGATLISLFGLIDDRWRLPALPKFLAQVAAVSALLIGGTSVQLFAVPGLNWLVTALWVVGITNAINFLDNMDGLSGGIATIAAAFFLLLAAMNEPRQVLVGAMAAGLIGACLGFLRYNLNPANVFMGDTGSLFIGFILAALAIKLRFPANVPAVTWMAPICILGLPILDTGLVVVARLRRRVNPFTTAGKDHLSHRLVALGLTKREAVLSCYVLAGAFGMVGVYMTQANLGEAYVVAGAMLAAIVAAIIYLERICPSGVPRRST